MRRAVVGLVALLALLLAGCQATAPDVPEETAPTPFQPCPAPVTPPGSPAPAAAAAELVPDVALPCFVGGQAVSLRALGQPAVINLWASSCGPCRDEMPELQRFADQTAGRVLVLGVITYDTRDAAAYAAADFGVRYPSLFDPDRTLLKALGRSAIPITLFVDAHGAVRHLDVSGALTQAELSQLATEHLGLST
jgi:thiol-disulfide isomerase/thioredoxin